ncbi:MAG: MBL fold metallo-hydrolase [Methanobacterium sp.]
MKTWNTKSCTIYQLLEGRSNSFLINSQNNYILIDTGRANSWEKLSSKLDEILGKNKLSCLILTHTHFDHVENAVKIKEKYKSTIIIHQSELEYIMQGNSPLPKGSNLATGFMVNVLGKKLQSKYQYEKVNPDIIVGEKYDLIDFGFNAYIIHTSGHSKGSMSIIIDNEIAIVGDAMFGIFGNSIYPPFADDPDTMVKSWNKLINTNCDLFLPGHGKEISRKLLESQYEKYK